MREPPPLPRRLGDIRTVVAVGTVLWLLGALGFGVARVLGHQPPVLWLTTCLAGALLGGVGHGISSWQRAAARRGSRTAQEDTQ